MVVECRICHALPDVVASDDPRCAELESIHPTTKRCPICSNYWDVSSAGHRRLTSTREMIARIRTLVHELPWSPNPTVEDDLDACLDRIPDPEISVEDAVRCVAMAVIDDEMTDYEPVRLAVWSLGRRNANEAIPTLVRALEHYALRAYAARALATIGALPALVQALDREPDTRYAATCGLGQLASREPALAPAIQRPLLARAEALAPHTYRHEKNDRELALVFWALRLTGCSEAVLSALTDKKEAANRAVAACHYCRSIPDVADREDPGGIPPACEKLRRLHHWLYRCPLCATYYRYHYDHDSGGGTSAGYTDETYSRLTNAEAVVHIRNLLHDVPFEPYPDFEGQHFDYLLTFLNEPEETVEALIRCVDAPIPDGFAERERPMLAAWSLGRRKAEEAIPTLVRALTRYPLHAHAARALATIGAPALPALVAAFTVDAREATTSALGLMARLHPALAGEIQRVLLARAVELDPHTYGQEKNSKELATIVWAIGMTGYSEAALALLVGMFGRTYGWERAAAIKAVAQRMRPVSVRVVPPLLSSTDRTVVEAAIEALETMGPAARDALPALDASPSDPYFDLRIERARKAITAKCHLCGDLPDHADYKPPVFVDLTPIGGSDLVKCPACDTYYEYAYEYYPGAPEYTVDPVENESLDRRTRDEAITWIRAALEKAENAALRRELELLTKAR